jgi:hypothetical protein
MGILDSFYDLVHCHSRSPHFSRQLCLPPILHQQFEAQVSNGQGRLGRVPAGDVLGVSLPTRIRLEPRGQGVAHACHQEAGRCASDDLGIHDHHIGVLGQDEKAL